MANDELENQESEDNSKETSEETAQDERLIKRKKKTESARQQATVRTALFIGVLVLVNIISVNLFFRLDLTPNKIYTLSQASKDIVGNLDDKMVVKAYFTDNLPAPYNNSRRYLQEILRDYRNYSHSNLEYEILSPADEEQLEKDAQKYGIQPVQVQTVKDDRAEALKAYMGVVFLYGGKQETLPFVGNTENLEYEITGVIKRLSEKQLKKIGVLTGAGLPGVDKIGKVSQFLNKFYTVTPVDASKNAPIANDIAVLIVFSPKAPQQQQQMMQQQQAPTPVIPENLKFAVDQYIMGGGKVIFVPTKVSVSSQQQFQFAQNVKVGIEDMLENYGVKLNSDIVMDKECATVSVPASQGGMQFYTQVPFPYYPKIININKDLPAFAGIGQIYLGFSCSLDTTAAMTKGVNVTPLLTTSPKSSSNNDIAIIQTTGKMPSDTNFKAKNLTVGAIYTGKYQSYYKGKPIPGDTITGSAPLPTSIKEQSPDTKIIAIGNGDFPQDEFRGPDENLLFFADMVDYMADDAGLSAIRQKDSNPKPLDAMDDSTRKILKYVLLIAPPGLVMLFGLMRWRRRKNASNK